MITVIWHLTDNHAHFTAAIFVVTRYHGGHCVVHHGNHIHLKVLNDTTQKNTKTIQSEDIGVGWEWLVCSSAPWGATYPSPLDRIPQQTHDVVPFCPRSLETFGPVQQNALAVGVSKP